MSSQRSLKPKSVFDEKELLDFFNKNQIKTHHIQTIYRYIIQNKVSTFDEIPEIPKHILPLLSETFSFSTSSVVDRKDASDGSTTKLLVKLQDGFTIETVVMRYGTVDLQSFPEDLRDSQKNTHANSKGRLYKSTKRVTVCISSQVGCAMASTGTMGLLSNLTTGEIIEQLMHVSEFEKIRNVVFMGMGEPLDNYSAVLGSIKHMCDTSRFGLSPSRVSISTVGVVPRIKSLCKDAPMIGLALSLHAPTQELREKIVPTSKAWHISKILDATFAFIDNQNLTKSTASRRHILIEYVLIANVNDSPVHGAQLADILESHANDVLVNVIPYNPTDVVSEYCAPSPEALSNFVDAVRAGGVKVMIRQELGQDISSACGQLVIQQKSNCGETDLEDLMNCQAMTKKKPALRRKVKQEREESFQMNAYHIGSIIIASVVLSAVFVRMYSR